MIGHLEKTVIDCPDPRALAEFYCQVLEMRVNEDIGDWVVIGLEPGLRQLAFQRATEWVPPRWPDPAHPQQLHLDIRVSDADQAEQELLLLGATRVPGQRETGFRVSLTPPVTRSASSSVAKAEPAYARARTDFRRVVNAGRLPARALKPTAYAPASRSWRIPADSCAAFSSAAARALILLRLADRAADAWRAPGEPVTALAGVTLRGMASGGAADTGHCTRIEAIIFDGSPATAALPEWLPTAPMAEGLTMLPVTREVLTRLDPDAIGDERLPGTWNLQQPVAALARALSRDRSVLYLFCETWAGPGTRENIAWRAGQLLYGPY